MIHWSPSKGKSKTRSWCHPGSLSNVMSNRKPGRSCALDASAGSSDRPSASMIGRAAAIAATANHEQQTHESCPQKTDLQDRSRFNHEAERQLALRRKRRRQRWRARRALALWALVLDGPQVGSLARPERFARQQEELTGEHWAFLHGPPKRAAQS